MQRLNLEQGSAEWLEIRLNKRTASETPIVFGLSPWTTPTQLINRKLGVEKFDGNEYTRHGTNHEAEARAAYEKAFDVKMTPCVMVEDDYLASLDGLSADGKIILEIKCPMSGSESSTWKSVVEGTIEDHYFAQIQHQLMVSGAEECHLFVYCTKLKRGVRSIIYPKLEQFPRICEKWNEFWTLLEKARAALHQPLPVVEPSPKEKTLFVANEQQITVVSSLANKILCVAGAGSGKTSTLVTRVARLIADGANASQFVIITYTNAAANELLARLNKIACPICGGCGFTVEPSMPNGEPEQVRCCCEALKFGYIGTLHGFLLRLLTSQHQLVGLPATLSVCDDDQRSGLVETIRAEMNSKASLKNIMPLLERADLISHRAGMSRTKEELVAVEYHQRLRQSGLLDFNTILYYGERLIKALDGWSYKFLFVDEFQDSADTDTRIYEAMPCPNKFFVGDSDQAIYGFRGGNIQNLLDIAQDAPDNGWKVFPLETNYRCGKAICDAAQRLIERNVARYPKITLADNPGGEVIVHKCNTAANELGGVLDAIQRSGINPGDIAVLARTNRIAGEFSDFLQSRGVPVAKKKFADNPADWRKTKLLLTFMANPWNDLVAYQYLVESQGQKKADEIKLEAAKKMEGIIRTIPDFKSDDIGQPDYVALTLGAQGISAESRERVNEACRKLSNEDWTISDLILFLNNYELQREETGTGVTVTTMHNAKGREWRHVFLVGCEQGTIPSDRKGTNVEEERRLFYVAMTRAKEKLFISHCENRPVPFQPHVSRAHEPSQFIGEMA